MNHPHLMTDQDLVSLFQNGEEHAFAELLKRHKDHIYSTIYYLVRDRDVAEDLFQDTFIRIISSLKKKHYNEEGKFLGWAVMVARHIVIDYFRANKMRMVREEEEIGRCVCESTRRFIRLSRGSVSRAISSKQIRAIKKLFEEMKKEGKIKCQETL